MSFIISNSSGVGIIGLVNNTEHPDHKIIIINNGRTDGDVISYINKCHDNVIPMKTLNNTAVLCGLWIEPELCQKLNNKYNQNHNFRYGGILLFTMNHDDYHRQVWLYDTDMINGFMLNIPGVSEYNFGNFVIDDVLYIRNTNSKFTDELKSINILTGQVSIIPNMEIRGSYNNKLIRTIDHHHILMDDNFNKISSLDINGDIISFGHCIVVYNLEDDQYVISDIICSNYKYIGGNITIPESKEFMVLDKYLIVSEFYMDSDGLTSSLEIFDVMM